MWDSHHWCCCFIPKSLRRQHPHQSPNRTLLLPTPPEDAALCSNCICFSAIARMLGSWLNRRRIRYLFLILCSPFLLPLFFATCPLICAVEICCFLRRKRRKADDRRGRCEEEGDRGGLLQRYLEDQLSLVRGSVEGEGSLREEEEEDDEDGVGVEYFDSARSLLQ